jgi:hypothetical protein
MKKSMRNDMLHQITSSKRPDHFSREHERQRVCLITALTIEDFVDPELTASVRINRGAQLGVLTLAAILRERSYETHVVNLDDLFLCYLEQHSMSAGNKQDVGDLAKENFDIDGGSGQSFFSFAATHIERLDAGFDVYGFSSICSSYPLTLRLASHIKDHIPSAMVLLGQGRSKII